jgi:pimeloyl-ACP methyl ester carboxylesterase
MRGHADMWPLRRHLRRAGFAPQQFSYPTALKSLRATADLLQQTIARLDGEPFHLVAHSYGGIVVMETLRRHACAGLQRVVTLGSPLTGSAAATRMASHRATRWMLGQSRQGLVDGAPALPPGVKVGSIAGTRNIGLGRLFSAGDQPGDGSVTVAETRPSGLSDHLSLPLSHMGLAWSALSARYVINFLRHGRFQAE